MESRRESRRKSRGRVGEVKNRHREKRETTKNKIHKLNFRNKYINVNHIVLFYILY